MLLYLTALQKLAVYNCPALVGWQLATHPCSGAHSCGAVDGSDIDEPHLEDGLLGQHVRLRARLKGLVVTEEYS